MKVDRRHLFDTVRSSLFGGGLSQPQVDGINAIVDECEIREIVDLRWIAYILATAYHETDRTMEPIEEYSRGVGTTYGEPHPQTGHIYYGRGLPQLTWYENYVMLGHRLEIPLAARPELALDLGISAKIIVVGMMEGLFVQKHRLATYFNVRTEDWVGARRIVNGLDRAEQIAEYGLQFRAALRPTYSKNYVGRFEREELPMAEKPKEGVEKAVTTFLSSFVTFLGLVGVAIPAWVSPELIEQIGWFVAIALSLGGSIPITFLTWLIPNSK